MSEDRPSRADHAATPVRPRAPRVRPTYRPVRSPLMSMGPSLEEERRRHRVARLVALSSVAAVVVVVLLVWIVGLLGREVVNGTSDTGSAVTGSATAATAAVEKTGPPDPQTIAEAVVEEDRPGLRLQLPIRREAITGIGFGPRREANVIELEPSGTRSNTSWLRRATQRFLSTTPASELRWFRLEDGAPSMTTIGALPGTEVYAPIDGTVQAISPYVIDGERRGGLIQLQPTGDGQTLVVLRNIDADEELEVGTTVKQSVTRLGLVRDMEGAIEAPLAAYTHDSGSGVELYVLSIDVGVDRLA